MMWDPSSLFGGLVIFGHIDQWRSCKNGNWLCRARDLEVWPETRYPQWATEWHEEHPWRM